MDGKNIVLLHGWGASSEKLKPLALALEKINWQVFVPKIPGFEAAAPDFAWDIDDYSEYIIKGSVFFYLRAFFWRENCRQNSRVKTETSAGNNFVCLLGYFPGKSAKKGIFLFGSQIGINLEFISAPKPFLEEIAV